MHSLRDMVSPSNKTLKLLFVVIGLKIVKYGVKPVRRTKIQKHNVSDVAAEESLYNPKKSNMLYVDTQI